MTRLKNGSISLVGKTGTYGASFIEPRGELVVHAKIVSNGSRKLKSVFVRLSLGEDK